jgi:hypothetical protein
MRRAFVILVLAAMPALAAAHDYSLLEAGFYGHEDTDFTDVVPNRGNHLVGYRVAIGVAMPTRPFAYFSEYGNTDVLEQFSTGLLYRHTLTPQLDAYGGASVEFEDMTDERGYGVRAGLRWSVFGDRFELNPEVRYEELFRATTSARLTIARRVGRHWYAQAAGQAGDEQRYTVGVRYVLR